MTVPWNNGILHTVDWESADHPITCPANLPADPNVADYIHRGRTGNDTAATAISALGSDEITIAVFPNPSNNSFNFILNSANNITGGNITVQITDIKGAIVANINRYIQSGEATHFTWEAANFSNGVYFYKAKLFNNLVVTGKLVKL